MVTPTTSFSVMETVTLWSARAWYTVSSVLLMVVGQGHVGVRRGVVVLSGDHLHRLDRAPVLRSVKVSTLLVRVVPETGSGRYPRGR